jgi:uncharacterized protein
VTERWTVPTRTLRPGRVRHEHRSAPLGRLAVAGTVVAETAPVTVDVDLNAISGGVEVIGTVSAPFEAQCRRCTRPVHGSVEAEVRELYRPRAERGHDEEEDEETYELGVDHLDLAPLARDAILLGLPLAVTCREACAGLCSRCGADLNTSTCTCAEAPVDDRWSVLDVLRDPPPPSPRS